MAKTTIALLPVLWEPIFYMLLGNDRSMGLLEFTLHQSSALIAPPDTVKCVLLCVVGTDLTLLSISYLFVFTPGL